MKVNFFLIIFLLYSISIYGLDIVEIKSIDTTKNPDANVDLFGNTEWKYPIGYFDPPKPIEKPKIVEKPNPIEKPKNKEIKKEYLFVKGNNSKQSIYGFYNALGNISGYTFGYGYTKDYITHNIQFSILNLSSWGSSSVVDISDFNYKFEYHAFPNWYFDNKTKKVIDGGISGLIGYNQITMTESNVKTKQSSISYGVGAFAQYKLSNHINIKLSIDVKNLNNKNLNVNYNTQSGIGISFDF